MIRDEFFWISQINKASVVSNFEEHLLDEATAKLAARGIDTVEKEAEVDASKRVKKYITYEPMVIAATGPEVTILHAGRSSQDILSTARVAILREQGMAIADALDTVIEKLLSLAEEHRDTLVPNYTNGVAAQPNSYAHYLLGFIAPMLRDRERLNQCLVRYNECPMGATVLNGTGWPLNRDTMARLLGFDRPRLNAFDCTCETPVDFALEISAIAAAIGIHVGSMINDIMVQYAQSRPWIILQEGGENTYVSSAMPQKRNPGLINNCRRNAAIVMSNAQNVMLRVHNLNEGMPDARDNQINLQWLTDAADVIEMFAGIVSGLQVNRERALEELNDDWTCTQNIADTLMLKAGIPFRMGHHFASNLVTWARANNKMPSNTTYEDIAAQWKVFSENEKTLSGEFPLSKEVLHEAMDPAGIVNARVSFGGPQEADMLRQKANLMGWLEERVKTLAAIRKKVACGLQELTDDLKTL